MSGALLDAELGLAARHRSIQSIGDGVHALQEAPAAYGDQNDHESEAVSPSNTIELELSY
jgi:hypothetical protein